MLTLLPGERLVTKALQQIKATRNSPTHIHRRVLKLCNWLVRRPHPSKIIPPFVAAIGWFGASKSEETAAVLETKSSMSEMENDFKKADDLYDNNELQKAYDLLMKYKEPQKCEVEWRLAKVKRMMAVENKDPTKKKELFYEAFDHAKLALSLDEKNFAVHKWYGIILSSVGEYEGIEAKLQNTPVVREHFEKAVEMNPSDAMSRHFLGVWCYTFANMGWLPRKVAATLFSSPPSSSHEEALRNFQKAEELEPNFHPKNHLFLGKTLLQIKKMDEAKMWLEKAVHDPSKTEDDKETTKEAKEILRKYF
ncbi:regulator of microtubule dynamics protein 1-like isoform X2 [Acropora muricata]|uniref:regulator of microtubule dynamics protein 1-like isoform X2 n=1 Tax=Acropora muricata TaxID=159855 RepID=UPI0034E4C769